jgi:hypothetical protein
MICSGVWRFLLIFIPSRVGRSYRKSIENPLIQLGPVWRGKVSIKRILSIPRTYLPKTNRIRLQLKSFIYFAPKTEQGNKNWPAPISSQFVILPTQSPISDETSLGNIEKPCSRRQPREGGALDAGRAKSIASKHQRRRPFQQQERFVM